MSGSIQFVVFVLLGAICYAQAYFPRLCPRLIDDGITKNNLIGEPVTNRGGYYGKTGGQGIAVCPSQTLVLAELEVTVEVGSGYNSTTQREQCWVDRDQDVRYEKCLAKQCSRCETRGAGRCIPVLKTVTFRAICRPKPEEVTTTTTTSTTATTTTTTTTASPKGYHFFSLQGGYSGYRQGVVLAFKSKDDVKNGMTEEEMEEEMEAEMEEEKEAQKPVAKIRDITLELPVCCQCQVLYC